MNLKLTLRSFWKCWCYILHIVEIMYRSWRGCKESFKSFKAVLVIEISHTLTSFSEWRLVWFSWGDVFLFLFGATTGCSNIQGEGYKGEEEWNDDTLFSGPEGSLEPVAHPMNYTDLIVDVGTSSEIVSKSWVSDITRISDRLLWRKGIWMS